MGRGEKFKTDPINPFLYTFVNQEVIMMVMGNKSSVSSNISSIELFIGLINHHLHRSLWGRQMVIHPSKVTNILSEIIILDSSFFWHVKAWF